MMKLQDVLLQAMAKKISWWEAAEIIGVTDRTMRRWRERLERDGYSGLVDRRKGRASDRRVPLAQVEEMLRLYRDTYFDLNMRHFHEKLRDEHGIELSYTFVQKALQGAGLVARGRKRRKHRRRRERRPMQGMLLHIDGSKHQWFGDLAGTAASGVAASRNRNSARRQRVSAAAVYSGLQPEVHGGRGRERNRIPAHHTLGPGLDLHGSDRARGGQGQYRRDHGAQLAVGEEPVSQLAGRLHRDDPSASGWKRVDPLWDTRCRPLPGHRRDSPSQRETAPGEPWKRRARGDRGKPQTGFPPSPPPLGNPATPAGFPLSHRSDCCCCLKK